MTTSERFLVASKDLADALALTDAEAAAAAVRYHDLKHVGAYVLGTGEVVEAGRYDKEVELLNAQLKQYIADHEDEPLAVEGLPPLQLQRPQAEDCDVPALLEHEPDVFYAAVGARALKIDVKLARKVLNPDQQGRLAGFVHKLGGTPRLVWGRER